MNMRDPVLYRIRFAHHHRTGDRWSVYPMYDYAHPLSDALERITHSLCTLEFEDHRPLYDWLIARVAEGGYFDKPLPRQIEFARLNLNYTITSKRRLQQLVSEGHVDGWDDPRMTTLVGPAPARLHAGIDPPVLRPHRRRQGGAVDRHERARTGGARRPRRARGARQRRGRSGAAGDHQPRRGRGRALRGAGASASSGARHRAAFTSRASCGSSARTSPRIRRKDSSGWRPDRMVRLRYGYVVKCTGFDRGPDGRVADGLLRAPARDALRHRPAPTAVKVKGNIHWVSAREAVPVELRIYDRLFTEPQPDIGGRDFLAFLNPDSKRISTGYAEPSIASVAAGRPPAVRAPGLLRRRSPRPPPGAAGVQPGHDPEGLVRQARLSGCIASRAVPGPEPPPWVSPVLFCPPERGYLPVSGKRPSRRGRRH